MRHPLNTFICTIFAYTVAFLIGGWPGAFLAQKALRHKSIKQEFLTVFWVSVAVNCLTLCWLLLTENGTTLLKSLLG